MNNYIDSKNLIIYYKSATLFLHIFFRWIITMMVISLIGIGISFWDYYTEHLSVPPYIHVFVLLCILVLPLSLQTIIHSFYFFGKVKTIEKALKSKWFLLFTKILMRRTYLNAKLSKFL